MVAQGEEEERDAIGLGIVAKTGDDDRVSLLILL